jgi:hypothetical protein
MSNTTLRHWDFATHFTGEEAAALIMGIDPNFPRSQVDTTYPIVERMRSAYQKALEEAIWAYEFKDGAGDYQSLVDITEKSTGLYSYRMRHISGGEFDIVRLHAGHWLNDQNETAFDAQKFTREELVRWLSAIEIKSEYQFYDLHHTVGFSPNFANKNNSTKWPWGEYETKLLQHLEAAANRFWVNYDPTDPSSAPVNQDVSTWLQDQRALSKKMGDSIATILRVDGLKTGPRK